MTSVWDKWGKLIPLTVVHVDRNQIIDIKTPEKDGYLALKVGAGSKNTRFMRKSDMGQFIRANVSPKTYVQEFKVSRDCVLPVGYMVGVRHFTPGQFIDVKAKSKGKGFQGVVARWGFKGNPASHGHSLSHRSHGSTGACQDPGRVFKGKKMAGRGGYKNRMIYSLQVYKIDYERSLVYIQGNVPGAKGVLVRITDAFKQPKKNKNFVNYPTFVYDPKGQYASIIEAEPSKEDPMESWLHENAVVKDDKDDGGED